MLRTNLSTRPFYNERIIHLLIALAGVILLGITVFNAVRVVDLSRQNTDLSTRVGRDRTEGDRLRREAVRIRKGIDPKELTVVAAAAREANSLIDQRTFSWTAFFNYLEATLPPDVMLVSVRPSIDRGATRVSMVVLGRTPEDIDEFIEKLEATGAFEKILPRQMDKTDEGLNRAVLDSVYTPEQAEAKPAEDAKPGGQPKPGEQPKAGDPAKPKDRSKTGNQTRPGAKSGATSKKAGGIWHERCRPDEARRGKIMSLSQRIFQEKRRLIYPLVVVLIVNVLIFAAVVYPLSLKVAAADRTAQAASIAAMSARREFDSAKNTVTGKAAADAELKKFYGEVLPPDQSAARRITSLKIAQLAKKTNVNDERAVSEVTQERDSSLGKLSTEITLSGQYRDIRRFIYELEAAPEFLILETVSLSQGSDASSGLNVTVRVATYYQAGGDGI